MTDTIDLLLDAVQVAYDEETPNEALRPPFIEHVEEAKKKVAYQAYLECLVVECGEGECARAIRTKFGLEGKWKT